MQSGITMPECLAAALSYLELGWSVIPIKPGTKSPFIQWTEFQQRRATVEEVMSWWARWPEAQAAVVTGPISGLVVLDVEAQALPWLKDKEIPMTPVSRTGGGGRHIFFRYPSGLDVPIIPRIADHVDIKGGKGYVLVPPSIHPSGSHYQWSSSPGQYSPAQLPDWLRALIIAYLRQKAPPPPTPKACHLPSKAPALVLSPVVEGQRNVMMTKAAGALLRKYHGEEDRAWAELVRVNALYCRPPLEERELRKIFDSIARRERGKADVSSLAAELIRTWAAGGDYRPLARRLTQAKKT